VTYLLDTNACVAFLRGTGPKLRHTLLSHSPSQVQIPAIVEAELLVGARKSRQVEDNLAAVRAFVQPFAVRPFDSACAEQYGLLRADLERSGTTVGPNDLLIAATALALGSVLVTHNTAKFARVPGLRLVDWQG